MIDLMQSLADLLEQGEDAALAAICLQSGSTPRTAGACMAVRRNGSIHGTIGGGLVEAQVITACRALLDSDAPARLHRFDLDNTQAAQAGMICGGRLDVALVRLAANAPDGALCRAAVAALRQGRTATLVCGLDGPERFVLLDNAPAPDLPQPPDALVRAATGALARLPEAQAMDTPSGRVLVLPMAVQSTAIIVGAGHVGQHTAAMLAQVGFRTVVIDDRAEFANPERFPTASRILVPGSFEGCLDAAGVNADSYVVILTRGHVHDKTVLAQALRTPAAYIGMIGSRRKRDATYAALRAEGVDDAAIARTHCPIGLAIGAETPEEIALSIAAEMVQARAHRRRRGPGM